jgi:hypothetical protein
MLQMLRPLFQENSAKAIGGTFNPGSGHGAILGQMHTDLGKSSTKIRRIDGTHADTREVTSSKTHQELNGLAMTDHGKAFVVATDAAVLLSFILKRVSSCCQQQQ